MKYFIPLVIAVQLIFVGCSGSSPDKVLPSVKEDSKKLGENANQAG